jgi:hypothetical protein
MTEFQFVEFKLLDNGLEFDELIDNGKFVTVKINKTANFKIYTYIRKINRLFNCCIHRKQHIVDQSSFYINIKKERIKF